MTAPTPPHPLDLAVEWLTERGACPNCRHPVHSANGPRGWIHTLTGNYRCPAGRGWAEPGLTEEQAEALRDEAHQLGRDECEAGHADLEDDAREDGHREGVAEGRAEMMAELNGAISAGLHRFRMKQKPTGPAADLYWALIYALTDAWNTVQV